MQKASWETNEGFSIHDDDLFLRGTVMVTRRIPAPRVFDPPSFLRRPNWTSYVPVAWLPPAKAALAPGGLSAPGKLVRHQLQKASWEINWAFSFLDDDLSLRDTVLVMSQLSQQSRTDN